MNIKTARRIASELGVNVKARPWLISKPEANPKTAKNLKFGIMTAPLHLAPAKLSGFQVCGGRSPGCEAACLHTAGNPAAMAGKSRARIAKTRFYFEQREAFLVLLLDDIRWLADKAKKAELKAGIRFNATSDIPWERIIINGKSVISWAQGFYVTPYDYTKIKKRALFPAYHLTFSRTENNDADCIDVLNNGGNVAAVFAGDLPKRWNGFPVIDGDESDWRPADGFGVIVGLKAKGDAKTDTSGFTIR